MREGPSSIVRSVALRLAVAYSVAVFALGALVMVATYVVSGGDAGATTLAVLVGMLPASIAIGWFLADRMLSPIGVITEAAEDIGRGPGLSTRIHLEGPDDELQHLAGTIDTMLDRIQEMAEERWAYVQDISHELRNPLAVMATTLDVALDEEPVDPAELRRSALVVRRTVDRAARSVDDLIIFARNETPESKRTTVDLSRLLEEVLAEHRGPIDAQRLAIELVGRSAGVNGDRDALKRALGNIVGNAVRLSRPGSLLRAGAGTHNGYAWVGVDDQGPGLDPREHDHVFRRFWSDDRASLGGEARTGLGLAITRQIAEQHGGMVTLRSELGAGAEFVIWIPTVPDQDLSQISGDGIHPLVSPLEQDDGPADRIPDDGSFIPA